MEMDWADLVAYHDAATEIEQGRITAQATLIGVEVAKIAASIFKRRRR